MLKSRDSSTSDMKFPSDMKFRSDLRVKDVDASVSSGSVKSSNVAESSAARKKEKKLKVQVSNLLGQGSQPHTLRPHSRVSSRRNSVNSSNKKDLKSK